MTRAPAGTSNQEATLLVPKWKQVLTHGFQTDRCQGQLTCDAETGRTFGDLWELWIDEPSGYFEEVDVEDKAQSAEAVSWQKCSPAGRRGLGRNAVVAAKEGLTIVVAGHVSKRAGTSTSPKICTNFGRRRIPDVKPTCLAPKKIFEEWLTTNAPKTKRKEEWLTSQTDNPCALDAYMCNKRRGNL
ncbi:hypothetical protein B0H13DRAFT_1896078 [Mycena leptocephala]|nr:hypothetical protein B0H13DRAFT_1896078 [Mycena leptocephala]